MSTNNFTEDVLVRFTFGQFGNYGSQLVVRLDGGFPILELALENWASVTITEGISSENLAKLGKELIQAAMKLEEIEKKAAT